MKDTPQVLHQTATQTSPRCLNGRIEWENEYGQLHRNDGPALILSNGTRKWYQHGQLHRDNGPAVTYTNGAQYWYQHGELHRDDGPAIIAPDGTREWYQHDQLHRDDGPAVIRSDGTKIWYQYGQIHRGDGPAIIWQDNTKDWYWYDKQIATASPKKPKRKLENRLNDLAWKDWLLFQKSFFHLTDDESLYGGLIQFFTKQYTPECRVARVMVIAVSDKLPTIAAHGRELCQVVVAPADIGQWHYDETHFEPVDFMVVDMRHSGAVLVEQIEEHATDVRQFLANCRAALKDGSFCVLLSQEVNTGATRYPLPWMLSSLARQSFRLRDERIGLPADDDAAPTYVNVLQAVEEIGQVHTDLPALHVGVPAIRKQWVMPKPKPRSNKEILHPAKFPEELIHIFISELTPSDAVVCDPMGGTGSTAVAALDAGRKAVVIELDEGWVDIARTRVAEAGGTMPDRWHVLHGDARDVVALIPAEFQPVAYTVTSPPYWRILHNPGMHVFDEGQRARQAKGLRTTYSENDADLGNITDYREFINELAGIYNRCGDVMESGRVLTIITKNVKFERAQYPIAWDLVFELCGADGRFAYAGTTFWCQDNVALKPFGMGCDWISNVLHNYCIHLSVR